ncbi:hypothetical protein GCM10011571_15770 [Marinithermofilum abyssi]|uniref:Uncharacterized protein n=1 Tax=Marinithermofilum abyssi TaxID=1571185 RepID=A0A8J2YDX7_9BACL|nr:hypothetical protein [Marinithermofilum abyssi]GGE15085.1 hypothetical protein GCM10011571_15770 [Marinithermofilum abyssi]
MAAGEWGILVLFWLSLVVSLALIITVAVWYTNRLEEKREREFNKEAGITPVFSKQKTVEVE